MTSVGHGSIIGAGEDLSQLTGRLLGNRYKLVNYISGGTFGAVYEAADERFIDKKVAVKISRAVASEGTFLREAHLLSFLNHDNIVQVLDHGSDRGLTYIVMELLKGETLDNLLRRYNGQLPRKLIVGFVRNIGHALAHAHENGLVHRDLKPQNVLLIETGGADAIAPKTYKFCLVDFGISAKVDAPTMLAEMKNQKFNGAGTLEYMAPEQVGSQSPSPQTDVYAFGVMLYQLLTGTVPFPAQGDTYEHMLLVMNAIASQPVPRPSEIAPHAKISPALEELILQCLEKDPALRPQSMSEVRQRFLSHVDALREGSERKSWKERTRAPRWLPAFAAAALLLAVAVLIVALVRPYAGIGERRQAASETSLRTEVSAVSAKAPDEGSEALAAAGQAPSADIDLISLAPREQWVRRDDGGPYLIVRNDAERTVNIPYHAPVEYDLVATVVRREIPDRKTDLGFGISTVFLPGGRFMDLYLDGYYGSGLGRLDKRDYKHPEVNYKGRLFLDGFENHVLCSVRQGNVQVVVNGKTIIDWSGDLNRFPALGDTPRLLQVWAHQACFDVLELRIVEFRPGPEDESNK